MSSCWKLPESHLDELTPVGARDLIVECFYFAQHETLARTKMKLGAAHFDDASIRTSVVGAVRLAFGEAGGDFDLPTLTSLASVIDVLARKADAWGTPADIVEHHHDQVMKMLERMARPGGAGAASSPRSRSAAAPPPTR